jgi:tRNA pseudouridine55 synthase
MVESFNDTVLLIDKPLKWTSFDVVNKIRYTGKFKKVGHAGTLDPLATGLLILCTGKKTKEIDTYQGQDKEYTGIIRLGSTTPSYDLETEPNEFFETKGINDIQIETVRKQFLGEISQIPPVFSAIKINGKRSYESARKGLTPELKSRVVIINSFEIETSAFPDLHFKISCSKGTYIRSIAHDFGQKLGIGSHLAELRRTKIGDFSVDNAYAVDQLVETIRKSNEIIPKII